MKCCNFGKVSQSIHFRTVVDSDADAEQCSCKLELGHHSKYWRYTSAANHHRNGWCNRLTADLAVASVSAHGRNFMPPEHHSQAPLMLFEQRNLLAVPKHVQTPQIDRSYIFIYEVRAYAVDWFVHVLIRFIFCHFIKQTLNQWINDLS